MCCNVFGGYDCYPHIGMDQPDNKKNCELMNLQGEDAKSHDHI